MPRKDTFIAHRYEFKKVESAIFSSFSFSEGIGVKTEEKFKLSGFSSWDDIMVRSKPDFISLPKWNTLKNGIKRISDALDGKNIGLIDYLIPRKDQWKLIPLFMDTIAYLDIETTGLYPSRHDITTIAVYDGKNIYNFVKDDNLSDFKSFISDYPAIATFYGKGFDVPFLRQKLRMKFPQIHFDVCFLMRKLGYKGGLKNIEKIFKIDRGDTEGLDGYAAVLLWQKFRRTGDKRYLNTLLAYNNEDVINLEFLLTEAYNLLIQKERIKTHELRHKEKKYENPYNPDMNVVKEILTKNHYFYSK